MNCRKTFSIFISCSFPGKILSVKIYRWESSGRKYFSLIFLLPIRLTISMCLRSRFRGVYAMNNRVSTKNRFCEFLIWSLPINRQRSSRSKFWMTGSSARKSCGRFMRNYPAFVIFKKILNFKLVPCGTLFSHFRNSVGKYFSMSLTDEFNTMKIPND